MSPVQRYAIYYAPPPKSEWWEFGNRWLACDEAGGAGANPPGLDCLTAGELHRITAHPRRYGFHGTLKAPFRVRAGIHADDLLARVQSLAAKHRAVALGQLLPVYLDGFVALVPSTHDPALRRLADDCVQELDDLRAPLDEADLARRGADLLDARGRELLQKFGYPHVLERFQFHLSLTGPVDIAQAGQLVCHLAPTIAKLNAAAPPLLDRLAVFQEPAPGAPLLRLADLELQR